MNPLFSDHRLKLGVFGPNMSYGCAATLAPGTLQLTWPAVKRIAQLADRAGMEAIVPVARWKGFGGPTNFNGASFETYTWAAGLAEATESIAVFATSHVPTIHPIVAAKQATTIDHISGGRFALNIVCGWFQPELEMFGAPIMEHDTRYEYAEEWLEIMRLLWRVDGEFDFGGRFLQVDHGFHEPKPIQRPHPPIMNAGGSAVGKRFMARHCDMAFIGLREHHNFEAAGARVEEIRRLAAEYGRQVQVWSHAYVVCRPTEQEARDYLHHYAVELGDYEAIENLTRIMGIQSQQLPPEALERFKLHFVAGWGGYPLIGTPEQIVEELVQLSQAGLDGCLLSWVNFEQELMQWVNEVHPLLEQAGLRHAPR